MTRAEAGRLGGKTTAERHGHDHMAEIGRRGFQALATKLGYVGGGRRGALSRLAGKGRIRLKGPPDLSPAEMKDLYASVGIDD